MSILRVEGCLITYGSAAGGPEVIYFAPYEDTLYECSFCHQQFAAWQEDLLYRKVREVRKAKVCPTCRTPLWQCLVTQGRIPWRYGERAELDKLMRAKGYSSISKQDDVWREYLNIFHLEG